MSTPNPNRAATFISLEIIDARGMANFLLQATGAAFSKIEYSVDGITFYTLTASSATQFAGNALSFLVSSNPAPFYRATFAASTTKGEYAGQGW